VNPEVRALPAAAHRTALTSEQRKDRFNMLFVKAPELYVQRYGDKYIEDERR